MNRPWGEALTVAGWLFQTRGAAEEKRRMILLVLDCGTVSRFCDDERRLPAGVCCSGSDDSS